MYLLVIILCCNNPVTFQPFATKEKCAQVAEYLKKSDRFNIPTKYENSVNSVECIPL